MTKTPAELDPMDAVAWFATADWHEEDGREADALHARAVGRLLAACDGGRLWLPISGAAAKTYFPHGGQDIRLLSVKPVGRPVPLSLPPAPGVGHRKAWWAARHLAGADPLEELDQAEVREFQPVPGVVLVTTSRGPLLWCHPSDLPFLCEEPS